MALAQGAPKEQFEVVEDMVLTGDVGSEVLSPLQVFIDASVRSVDDLSPDQAVYIAKIRTLGWIEANYDVSEDTIQNIKDTRKCGFSPPISNSLGTRRARCISKT